MIIIDATQICIASIVDSLFKLKAEHINEGLVRHIVLNSIRHKVKKFKKEYGPEVILAFDGPEVWRKEIFEGYKYHRKKARAESAINWDTVYKYMDMVRVELAHNFPYVVVHEFGVEADDIIAVLTKNKEYNEKVLIISSDKDFNQLISKDVKQFSPKLKHLVDCKNPAAQLKELIIRGDDSDGIPNVLSPDHTFVAGIRQKVMTEKRFEMLMNTPAEKYEKEVLRNFKRNQALIDFNYIPMRIEKKIKENFKLASAGKATRQHMLKYLMEKRLNDLIENANDF